MKKLFFRFGQILCLLFFILMLFQSSLVLKYAKEGLTAWASCVLPLLLPFIILSKFWIRYDVPGLFLARARRIFPHHPDFSITLPIFLLGLCSGFPVGAIFISHYYQLGTLQKKQAETLLPLASFVSPMFIIGYVRSQTGLQGPAWFCYVFALYCPVFVSFLFMQVFKKNTLCRQTSGKVTVKQRIQSLNQVSSDTSVTETIWIPSLEVIFIIGIYMMIFSILSGMLTELPLFHHPACIFLVSNLEITTGIRLLVTNKLYDPKTIYVLTAVATSLGGICTMAQVQTTVSYTDLSIKPYIKIKLLTAGSTLILCLLYILFSNL